MPPEPFCACPLCDDDCIAEEGSEYCRACTMRAPSDPICH